MKGPPQDGCFARFLHDCTEMKTTRRNGTTKSRGSIKRRIRGRRSEVRPNKMSPSLLLTLMKTKINGQRMMTGRKLCGGTPSKHSPNIGASTTPSSTAKAEATKIRATTKCCTTMGQGQVANRKVQAQGQQNQHAEGDATIQRLSSTRQNDRVPTSIMQSRTATLLWTKRTASCGSGPRLATTVKVPAKMG